MNEKITGMRQTAVQEEPTASPTSGMNLRERILHVGGWETERGTVEFGSMMAVDALVSHVLRDIAVQGEPVAWKELAANWLREKAAAQQVLNEKYPEHAKCYPTWKNWVLKLNWLSDELSAGAAPQPAEQPECGCCGQTVKCDDDCDAVVIGGHRAAERQSVLNLSEAARCLGIAQEKGDQDAIDHWGAMVARFERVLIQPAEQQPPPDVAGLIGKMHMLVAAGNRLNEQAEECIYDDGMAEVADAAKLVAALEGLLAIVSESSGVAGYHLNGEVADWREFEEVEMAEEALTLYRK